MTIAQLLKISARDKWPTCKVDAGLGYEPPQAFYLVNDKNGVRLVLANNIYDAGGFMARAALFTTDEALSDNWEVIK